MQRRAFFRQLVGRGDWVRDRVTRVAKVRLADIPRLPTEVIAELRPAPASGVAFEARDGVLWARRGTAAGTRIGPIAETRAVIAARFDGSATLAQIATALAAEHRWSGERALAETREVFLSLVADTLVTPVNALPVRQRVLRSVQV